MSHINFDFLTESFLFGSGLEDKFSALSDYELEKELNRYREYVISNMGEICREIISDSRKIAVTIESFSERPREELLKQLALYVDVVTISDLTQSTLKAQLLSKEMGKQSVDSQIANMALQLDVPVLENSKIGDIISIRNDYGESFANFRTELGEKLLHLSNIKDNEQLENELQEVTYAINETYINQINRETRSLIRSLGI